MAVCRLRLAQGLVKYGGHLIDFRGAPAPPDPPRTPPGVKIYIKKTFLTKIWWVQKVAKFGPPP